jgi:dTDP-4-dehydrorhamnose reductase
LKILVTGKNGQLARCLALQGARQGAEITFIGRPEHDLADLESLADAVGALRPDAVIAAAAYTAVDKAEFEPDLAMRVNGEAPRVLARICRSLDIPIVLISTDYVFNGSALGPYVETDPVDPINAYGRSKLAGEGAVAEETDNYAILRTAWVFSPFGNNFVLTMLRLAQSHPTVRVVSDTLGNPTSALDLAKAALEVTKNLVGSAAPEKRGIFHAAGLGDASWADLAEAVFAQGSRLGLSSIAVERITSAQFPTPARRPANSRLDCSKLRRIHGISMLSWRTALDDVIDLIAANAK